MFRRNYFLAWAGFLLAVSNVTAQETAGVSIALNIPPIPNVPFTATVVTDSIQTLADGTTVATKTMSLIARDSKGRTHNENCYPLTPSDNGQRHIREITIYDPASSTETTLTPATLQKTVMITATAPRKGPPEDLGLSTINGLTVHGFRQSRNNGEGNDPPTTITDEYWYSDELQMNITLKHIDPRLGTQLATLTQLNRDEPDEKMFQIPSNYKEKSAQPGPIRIGEAVAASNLLKRVDPEYPALAKSGGVQGTVEFAAVIGEDGTVKDMQLVSGHPLPVRAARDAVLQWKYRPTLLNGKPVAVLAPVTVNFTLTNQNH